MSRPVYSVYIVEDHPLMAEALTTLIAAEADLRVCGRASSAEEALAALPMAGADVVIVDVLLPAMNGIELVARLREAAPQLRCLVVTAFEVDLYAEQAQAAGAWGYVEKDRPDLLLDAIRAVLAAPSPTFHVAGLVRGRGSG